MVRPLFVLAVVLALLGDLRILLFVLNRFVWGSHRHEKPEWSWLMFATPPLLAGLTLLFWPLSSWIDRLMTTRAVERITPENLEAIEWSPLLARTGAVWLIVAAIVGLLWIVDRIHAMLLPHTWPAGVVVHEPSVVRLRRAHIPYASLQRLGAHNDVYDIEVTHHEVFVDGLPAEFDGYRLAFLTDTHVASFVRRDFYDECRSLVRAFEPDLIVLGGDFVTWNRHIGLAAEVLTRDLSPRDGMVAVLGNHDYWANAGDVIAAFEARGVRFLTNRSISLQRGEASLRVAGVDEVYRGTPDVAAAFAEVPDDEPCIAVSHHPDIIDLLSAKRIDLLLCGHTHGGQIRFPFFGPIVVPSAHEGEYASGFHRVRRVLLYVSRGIGAIPPLRILCRPEIATFTLRSGRRI